MKGLILKDLYAVRFQLLASALILALPYIGCAMILFDILEKHTDMVIIINVIYGILNYCSVVLFSSFSLNTINDDIASGWIKTEGILPVKQGSIIKAKLISSALIVATNILFALLGNVPCIIMLSGGREFLITLPICFGFMQLLALAPTLAAATKYGSAAANIIYILLVIITAVAAIIAAFAIMSNDLPLYALRLLMYVGIPVLSLCVMLISYTCGKNQLAAETEK